MVFVGTTFSSFGLLMLLFVGYSQNEFRDFPSAIEWLGTLV